MKKDKKMFILIQAVLSLLVILLVNVVNEVIKVIRRLIVEDAATQAEKKRPAARCALTAESSAGVLS